MLRYVLLFASLAKSGNESPINTPLVKSTSGDSFIYASQEQVHVALSEENVQIEQAAFVHHLHGFSQSYCYSWETVCQAIQILLRIGEPTILNKEGPPITSHSPKISLIPSMWTYVSNPYLIRIYQGASPWISLTIHFAVKAILWLWISSPHCLCLRVGFKFLKKQVEYFFPSSFPHRNLFKILNYSYPDTDGRYWKRIRHGQLLRFYLW